MRNGTGLKFAGVFALGRLVVGLLMALFQRATSEGDFIVFVDLPTLGLEFLSAKLFGWPEYIRNANDLTFHAFGVCTWLAIGAIVGSFVQPHEIVVPPN